MAKSTLSLLERFEMKYMPISETGCWIWMGTVTGGGYGGIAIHRKKVPAHRLAWELFRGPIPEGLEIDHLCRVRACVNPDHLEPVTSQINCLRGVSPLAANAKKTHCPRGHELVAKVVAGRKRRWCPVCWGGNGGVYNGSKTHCKHGHEFAPENTILKNGKYRACRQCKNASSRTPRARMLTRINRDTDAYRAAHAIRCRRAYLARKEKAVAACQ